MYYEKPPKSVELESIICPLGCKGGDKIVLRGYDRLNHIPGVFNVVKCIDCGLMRTNPRPTPETIGIYYPDDYGPYRGTHVDYGQCGKRPWPYWKSRIRDLFHFNTNLLPSMASGKMLEIGCASGVFLHAMASHGWDVEGLEFSEKAAESARSLGYKVYGTTVEDAPDLEKIYDLVVGWMVFEHLHDPVLALRKIRRWLSKEGWLVLSIPNTGSLEFKVFRENWYAMHLPNHLYHYTPSTIARLFDKEGWEITNIFHQRTISNLIASLGYWLMDHGTMKRLSGRLIGYPDNARVMQYILYPIAWMLSRFGETGRMTIWARMRDD